MPNYGYIALIPLLPLVSFVVLGLFGRRYMSKSAGIIATIVLLASTIISFFVAYQYFFQDGLVNGAYQSILALKYDWLRFSPTVTIDMSVILDPISVMMIVVVSFVSLMVHIFSLGYMKGETRFATYYAFLSLFTFSMLGLVLAGNLLQIYIFWELVGVSSYLLIGYYFDKPAAVSASKKAFIVTRLADLGFLVGILILAFHGETLDFQTLITRLTTESPQLAALTTTTFAGISFLTWGLTLIFMGGAGKSAMFPLHIWLPDAMEGPTPVSALIHAATMVVAGVYLVARLFPIFAISGPAALEVVMYTGAFSALLAAVIACTQTDIKRVLAYSTMSQIGYMMFALGVARYGSEEGLGYTASMFHLFTHAFFKSLLFLCAGAVIHLVHTNEIHQMGGLRKLMPVTHVAFLIACLAIAGIPPLAGFFSKEEILLASYRGDMTIYFVGLITSGLTAFYMFRLYFSVFWNKDHPDIHHHTNEGSFSMKLPLIVLAIATVAAGFVPFSRFVTCDSIPRDSHIDLVFSIVPVALSILGILVAAWLYRQENDRPQKIATTLGGFYRAAYGKFYIDEIYLFITKKIIFNLVGRPAAWIDKNIVDGFMNLVATLTGSISGMIRGLQSGKIQQYTIYFFAGVVALAVIFVYWNKVGRL